MAKRNKTAIAVDVRVRVDADTTDEVTGVVVDDFGDDAGEGVDIGGVTIVGPARRWRCSSTAACSYSSTATDLRVNDAAIRRAVQFQRRSSSPAPPASPAITSATDDTALTMPTPWPALTGVGR